MELFRSPSAEADRPPCRGRDPQFPGREAASRIAFDDRFGLPGRSRTPCPTTPSARLDRYSGRPSDTPHAANRTQRAISHGRTGSVNAFSDCTGKLQFAFTRESVTPLGPVRVSPCALVLGSLTWLVIASVILGVLA